MASRLFFATIGRISRLKTYFHSATLIRKDYILRLIEEAGNLFARLLGLRVESRHEEAIRLLDETYASFFGLTSQQLLKLSPEELVSHLWKEAAPHEDQVAFLVELMREESEIYAAQGDWNACSHTLRQGIRLLQELNRLDPKMYHLERIDKISRMESRLLDIPAV
jgi:hypothetical protein